MKNQLKTALTLLMIVTLFSSEGQGLFADSNEKAEVDKTAKTPLFSQSEHTNFIDEKNESPNNGRFSSINLNELRKTVLNEMVKDDLIDNKKARVYLFLREEGITFNDQKLSNELNQKYIQLLAPYEIGTGPDRTVFLSKDCTAVGDFTGDAFHGKMQGRLRIEYTQRPFEF